MAIRDLLILLNGGYEWIVDIVDLEKFLDSALQDRLMSLVHNIINDGDMEEIRSTNQKTPESRSNDTRKV